MKPPHFFEYSETLEVKVACQFKFKTFPFDKHHCDFNVIDTIYESSELVLREPLGSNTIFNTHTQKKERKKKEKNPLTFSVIFAKDEMRTSLHGKPLYIKTPRIPHDIEIKVNPSSTFVHLDECFSVAGFSLKLKRNTISLLLCSFYVPTGAFTTLSLISFLIHPDQVNSCIF